MTRRDSISYAASYMSVTCQSNKRLQYIIHPSNKIYASLLYLCIIVVDTCIAPYSLQYCYPWFRSAHILTPKATYNACCHHRGKVLFKHITIASYQVLIFNELVKQSQHDIIVADGASNPRPFGYESYELVDNISKDVWV